MTITTPPQRTSQPGANLTSRRPARVLFTCTAVFASTMLVAARAGTDLSEPPARLEPANTPAGYIARLLINETPFPGERSWVSEEDTRAAMESILGVLHSRIRNIPPGYRQEQIATVKTQDIIDVITAGGEKGQCDGFYRNAAGQFVAVPRVHQRIERLISIANKGEPGRFARLINYAQELASRYVAQTTLENDRFGDLTHVGKTPVTGHAYSWMADRDCYNPGGNFVKIPDAQEGSLGGNRFFTLRELKP